jgi:single-strand DNA-binding protein
MSLSLNKATLAGNIGDDPKIEYLPGSGTCKATFSLATNEVYRNKNGEKVENTQWHRVTFFGKPAEIIEKYVKKGSSLYVEGKIEYSSWEDKQTGEKKYMTNINGRSFQFLSSPERFAGGESKQAESEAPAIPTSDVPEGFDPDDLPF